MLWHSQGALTRMPSTFSLELPAARMVSQVVPFYLCIVQGQVFSLIQNALELRLPQWIREQQRENVFN